MTESQVPLFVDLSDEDCEGGACPVCACAARLMTCWECCDSSWVVACGHRASPPPMRLGRCDGTDAERIFCSECAEVLVEPLEAE
jgi:hypothetical protein